MNAMRNALFVDFCVTRCTMPARRAWTRSRVCVDLVQGVGDFVRLEALLFYTKIPPGRGGMARAYYSVVRTRVAA